MNQDAPARQPLPDDVQPRPDQLATGGTPDSDTGSAPVHSFTPRFHHSTPSIPDHELLRCIGGGSCGEVWLARNVLGDYRAVKVIYRDRFEHDRPFEREFEGIQKFEPISRMHESQVDILHVGRNEKDGYFYYVMELADDANVARASSLPVARPSVPAVPEDPALQRARPAARMQPEPAGETPAL